MNEQTRPVRVYFHAEGPPRPAFEEDIDKGDAENYSYCGWLPRSHTSSKRSGNSVNRRPIALSSPSVVSP